jgi:RNA polymerase sigma-70 factor, ECF subfamily
MNADKDAAYELVEIYHAEIFAYLRRLCGNREDAEDLTQQTFLKVWSSLDRFEGRSGFSTWLHTVAHNTYIDWLRRGSGRARNYPDPWWDECIHPDPGPGTELADRQMAQRLYEAVDQLDDNLKYVVHLHYYQQLSIRQTARVLNVASSTIKYRLRQVLSILRTRLGSKEIEANARGQFPSQKEEQHEYGRKDRTMPQGGSQATRAE